MRCGIGYDLHAFSPRRKLILGGVHVPYKKGLAGHSDADVLVHSITDALLGACGERDIGYYFPDTDPELKGTSSLHILEKVYNNIVKSRGFFLINTDSTLILQEPYLSSYIPQMINNIAKVLQVKVEQVAVKATRPEGLGYLGEKKGVACLSIVSIGKEGVSTWD
ncbi:2-C-methyl-D-erythritol 2,4-cyclodiphosphate synthase [Candidatus Aerophobetes bacterium]|nr:2-C-methyl-D-erythritol 2,4-cyclodiphosphate synthase [Candidatus Aerophobetes bacterium]